jgi:DNA gyrase subunit A
MALANEDRGGLVGAFIVEEGDEVLSITQAGQVVRSPINDHFRPTGRSTMGVRFVTPKEGDAVAVVARSVESREDASADDEAAPVVGESSDARSDATIEGAVSPDRESET